MIVGSGPLAPSAEGVAGYASSSPHIISPHAKVPYLDATTTASTSTTPASPGASHVSITHNHRVGDHSDDIRPLQQFLNTHGFRVASSGPGSPGNETTKFGALTYQALVKFQKAHGLPATGYLGPMTRSLINTQ
jgi:peptidoglycan hydrolase-like protein with peptidoglycan-binding domain